MNFMPPLAPLTWILLWLSVAIASAGLALGFLMGFGAILPWLLLGGGVLGMGLVGLGYLQRLPRLQRPLTWGTNSLLALLSVVVILGFLNALGSRYFLRWDLTETQLLTLAPQSQSLVRSLKQPLRIWVFDESLDDGSRRLLDLYAKQSPLVRYELTDPNQNLNLAQKFQVQQLGDVVLVYGDRHQLVQSLGQGDQLSESKLTNGIARLTQTNLPHFYLLQGHGEVGLAAGEDSLSQGVAYLRDQGMTVEELTLLEEGRIPEDADALVIAGPKRDFLPRELAAIQDFLKAGKGVVVLLSPRTNPGLETLWREWGLVLDDRLVVDDSGMGAPLNLGPTTPVITTYGTHPITEGFEGGLVLLPEVRPLGTEKVSGVEAIALLRSGEDTWAEAQKEIRFTEGEDPKGPFDLALAFTQEEHKGRLVVLGSSAFATDRWLGQQLNRDLFLNALQWSAQGQDPFLAIRVREPKNRRLNFTPLQTNGLWILALVVVPGMGLATACGLWWQRR